MSGEGWRWFGVKTVFRAGAEGGPTLVEERVVLLRARTAGEAIRAAEREARAYEGGPWRNAEGATVRRRYLGACTAYELLPGDARRLDGVRGRVEVFSDTRVVAAEVDDAEVVERLLGGAVDGAEREARWRTFVPAGLVERFEREAGG